MNDPELTECVDALMRWLEASGGESGEEMAASEAEVEEIWQAGWTAGREAQADEARFHYDQAIAAQRRMEGLEAEVERLQATEREALRVLGAIINQHVQGRVEVPEEALLREYTVSRTRDPASMTVRFRAEPADEPERF